MSIEKPNYKDGSIVNLMSSIKMAYGGKSIYKPLKTLDLSSFPSQKNILLIVIDGLGYKFLNRHGKESFLYKHLQGKITSVFPATTACAMTAFSTGVPAQQHGLTGWFVYLKELGTVSAILPFSSRACSLPLSSETALYKEIFNQKSFFEDLNAKSFFILNKDFANSPYSKLANKGAERLPFKNIDDFFKQTKKAVSQSGRTFTVAYWDKFDATSHTDGANSSKTINHFHELDKKIQSLSDSIKNEVTIIVTADHGLIDTKKEDTINVKDHLKFAETLVLPLSGDSRTVYCYVRPDKIKQFEDYVKTTFKKYCELHKSANLIKEGYFGLFEPNPELVNRIGDYTLIMKENYLMKDLVLGEKRSTFIGHHSGLSKEEMLVPLVIIE